MPGAMRPKGIPSQDFARTDSGAYSVDGSLRVLESAHCGPRWRQGQIKVVKAGVVVTVGGKEVELGEVAKVEEVAKVVDKEEAEVVVVEQEVVERVEEADGGGVVVGRVWGRGRRGVAEVMGGRGGRWEGGGGGGGGWWRRRWGWEEGEMEGGGKGGGMEEVAYGGGEGTVRTQSQ
ncbi:hypothetical protein CYMTET_47980 [Cymbomonas tetramitiformis]|uniref:Uncharacterized protein n=1 Tax=Cymbomonas tetramitiformis TaxID=36881 RepID=A0AAE0BT45_9CHLO|nr:hypothetical protein CYMTET_47980 [Cymbomonas tetramitiformis]